MKFVALPGIALLLFTSLLDLGVKGNVIPVPDTQPPIFLGHYNFPLTDVTLNFNYLSPNDCQVPEHRKLSSITISVPRGASVLNVLEMAANKHHDRTFQVQYIADLGYHLSVVNLIPGSGSSCQWSWTSDPKIFSASGTAQFSLSDAYIPTFYNADVTIDFNYDTNVAAASSREKQKKTKSPIPSDVIVTPENITVLYQLAAQGGSCVLTQGLSSIPATPLTVAIQAGGSALNVMERAADLDSTMQFQVANIFGIFYDALTIANVSSMPGCQWCLTYQPPSSQEIIVPNVQLQNFVIPTPGTTLIMKYTGQCSSSFQVALANRNMTYFIEKGIIKPKHECWGYSWIIALVVGVISLLLCIRYFR